MSNSPHAGRYIGFSLQRTPKSLNVLLGMHWRKRSHEQAVWDSLVFEKWTVFDRFVFTKPVVLKYSLFFDQKRQRDRDNYLGGTKFVTDALKRTFLLRDDSNAIRALTCDFFVGKPRTVVHISSLDLPNLDAETAENHS